MATSPQTPAARLEAEMRRVADLQNRHTRLQVTRENLEASLREAQTEATLLFNTDSPEEILQMAQQSDQENAAAVNEFIRALNEVEASLQEIDRQISAA